MHEPAGVRPTEVPSVRTPPFLARACDTPIVGLRAKAVFVAMARRQATPEGSCFASDDNLAVLAGCDPRTVRRGRVELERMGRIVFVGWRAHSEHSRTKVYRVLAETDSLSVPEAATAQPAADSLSVSVEPGRTTVRTGTDNVPPEVEVEEKIKITPPSPRKRGVRPRAAERRAMGPDYADLHAAGIEAAETAEWFDCGDCGSPVLADMNRCPKCGSTTINARPVVGQAREDTMQTPRPYAQVPTTPTFARPYANDPEFLDVLAAYQCIRTTPLTELERDALAELPPADVLAWLAQADGADAARGAA